MEDLEELVRRSRGGDAAAFEEIVRRFSRRAVASAHLITGDLHTGEEAAQDAFVVAWRKLSDLRDPAAFRGWFGTVLARTAIRHRRRPHVPLAAAPEPAAPPASPAELRELPALVAALPAKYREVLALRYVEGLSHREIALALGISEARVKSRLHDGRELVRRKILERGGRP